MLAPDRLLRLINEMIFLLLGALIAWIGLTGRLFFDRRSLSWVIVSVAMILWGLRALLKVDQWLSPLLNWTRGLSLLVVGVLMVAVVKAPFSWVGPLMALAGAVLIARGVVGTILVLRPRHTGSRVS
jgi:hypothetical protein